MNSDMGCFRDPIDGAPLMFRDGALQNAQGLRYPVVKGIPRFVSGGNYSDDFGKQWTMFAKTQLDSYSGVDVSGSRLERCLRAQDWRSRPFNMARLSA